MGGNLSSDHPEANRIGSAAYSSKDLHRPADLWERPLPLAGEGFGISFLGLATSELKKNARGRCLKL